MSVHPELPELHRPIAVDRVTAAGQEWEVKAEATELAAIARRLGVPAVKKLSCRFRVSRPEQSKGGVILAEGHLRVSMTRECVVSLENFTAVHEERFRVRFVPSGTETEDEDPESDDEIPYGGTMIDLGEAAVEQLALSLDPYPRKPGAELPPEASDAPSGPFSALAGLVPKS